MGDFNIDICEKHIGKHESHRVGVDTQETLVTATACPNLNGHGLRIVGISDAREGFRFVRHCPREWQVMATISGHGRVWTGSRWEWCGPGQIYVTPSQVYHAYYAIAETPWRLCWVMYSAAPAELAGLREPHLYTASATALLHAIEGLTAEVSYPGNDSFLESWTSLIDNCARRLLRQDTVSVPDLNQRRLRTLWDAVERDLAHPWDNQELARRASLSVEHLRRLSQAQAGHSPMKHVTYLRMRYASALLSAGTYTVGSVAAQVGYDNPFAFSVAFKRQFGVSPSDWRTRTKL